MRFYNGKTLELDDDPMGEFEKQGRLFLKKNKARKRYEYDQFVALIALIAGLGKPSLYTIESTAAPVPPFKGALP